MSCVFLCYLTKAAIYFIIFLHTVNLQRQTVKLTLQLVLEYLQASFLPDCQALRRHVSPDGRADVSLGSPPPWAGQGTDEHWSHLSQGEQMSRMSQSPSPRTLPATWKWEVEMTEAARWGDPGTAVFVLVAEPRQAVTLWLGTQESCREGTRGGDYEKPGRLHSSRPPTAPLPQARVPGGCHSSPPFPIFPSGWCGYSNG